MSWKVARNDKIVAEGLSDAENGGSTAEGWSQASRTVGRFNAEKPGRLRLTVRLTEDASALSATNPRLKVIKEGSALESALVVTGLLNVACGAIGVIGIVLLFISFFSAKAKV